MTFKLFKNSSVEAEQPPHKLREKWQWIDAVCVQCGATYTKRSTARRTIWCESCHAARREYRKKGHEASTKLTKKWRAEGKPCEMCGAPGEETHHKVRLADGGGYELDNLIFLCRKCHFAQHSDNTYMPWWRGR